MAATSDVIAQDGAGNIKLHPYLVTLVRWCVSCLWSTANILIHRLLTTQLPPITASRPPPKPRAAGTDHLHPEPLVECVVLHTPPEPRIDVIFVHGLYGSLGNTWRQGDWRPKYKIEPNKIPLIDNATSCQCQTQKEREYTKTNQYESKIHDASYKENFYTNMKIIPNDDVFITEKFYNNTLLDQVEIVDNYEMQANFVRDLFENDYRSDTKKNKQDSQRVEIDKGCECATNEGRGCEIGCGCICDLCYSTCWPRDWIKLDYPDARVISINYTSDPYLWRPLWVKENKRLRLHERAEQMTRQLLEMGVGDKPIIWVGHSKGGLFIKQIYCEAYEAYLKTQDTKSVKNHKLSIDNDKHRETIDCKEDNTVLTISEGEGYGSGFDNKDGVGGRRDETSSISEEDVSPSQRSGLWRHSCGFMFYSVPHRGSPLADIKTPITARSIELLEISKDCALVLSLQERWLRATAPLRPAVRSLVETTRTLMSVLWLRIVSVTSADAGIGALYGVSVDHREICKPSSRYCLLYTELMNLMKTALNKCRCQ